jgi:hypothetical protein
VLVSGFKKGSAVDFGVGVLKGTGSLVKHTVQGVGTAMTGVTSSVGNAVAMLSMDDEYIQKRTADSASKKPSNVLTGTVDATKKIGMGLFQGVTGVFTAPVRGAQEGGLLGFGKGLVKGTVGLAIKPVAGVIDAATSVGAGIKNTGEVVEEARVRSRFPRMLYGSQKAVKIYDEEAAWVNWVLKHPKLEGRLAEEVYHSHTFKASEDSDRASLVVVLESGVVSILLKENKKFCKPKQIEWVRSWEEVDVQESRTDSQALIVRSPELNVSIQFPYASKALALINFNQLKSLQQKSKAIIKN